MTRGPRMRTTRIRFANTRLWFLLKAFRKRKCFQRPRPPPPSAVALLRRTGGQGIHSPVPPPPKAGCSAGEIHVPGFLQPAKNSVICLPSGMFTPLNAFPYSTGAEPIPPGCVLRSRTRVQKNVGGGERTLQYPCPRLECNYIN